MAGFAATRFKFNSAASQGLVKMQLSTRQMHEAKNSS
jgi:hypothetical protein